MPIAVPPQFPHCRRIVTAFSAYMEKNGYNVTRAPFERNLAAKLRDRQFSADIGPLLARDYRGDMEGAARTVSFRLIARLPSAPWKGWTGA